MSSTDAFLDSNVWLYAFITGQDPHKTTKALHLINSLSTIFVSTQVINEVCVNLLRKQSIPETEIRDFIALTELSSNYVDERKKSNWS